MRVRVRGPQGATQITIDDSAPYSQLKQAISDATDVSDFDLKYGFPPRAFNTESINGATLLSDLGVKLDGEQFTVVPRNIQAALANPMSHSTPLPGAVNPLPAVGDVASPPRHRSGDFPSQSSQPKPKPSNVELDAPEVPAPELGGMMALRVMPDDNSCMFRALSSATLGSELDSMHEIRSMVASTIQSAPEIYTAAILGREPEEYCEWITREDSWGGGIELSILSQQFDVEICSIDVQSLRVDRFNENASRRVILVYSGIHYDVVAFLSHPGADPSKDIKQFDVIRMTDGEEMDGGALTAALAIGKELQRRHYWTDTQRFSVRCGECGESGAGEKWAVGHAKATGHTDLSEVGG